jgi:hypothetical protein
MARAKQRKVSLFFVRQVDDCGVRRVVYGLATGSVEARELCGVEVEPLWTVLWTVMRKELDHVEASRCVQCPEWWECAYDARHNCFHVVARSVADGMGLSGDIDPAKGAVSTRGLQFMFDPRLTPIAGCHHRPVALKS